MLLVYMSITGNVREFVERTGFPSHEINPTNPYREVDEDYLIVVPSYVGLIDEDVIDFIEHKNNKKYLKGFASSGNLNFNDLYCVNAKFLSNKYKKPLIFTFEYSGTDRDVDNFKKEVKMIEVT